MKSSGLIAIFLCSCLFSSTQTKAQKTMKEGWTSLVQSVSLSTEKEKKFQVKAMVKVVSEGEVTQSGAGVWARVDNKNDEDGFFENMMNTPIVSSTWQEYTNEGVFDENAESLKFGVLVYGNASFYFDNFKLMIENDEGEFIEQKINNPSFELQNGVEAISGWQEGIHPDKPFQAVDFMIQYTDVSTEGNKALLITNLFSALKP